MMLPLPNESLLEASSEIKKLNKKVQRLYQHLHIDLHVFSERQQHPSETDSRIGIVHRFMLDALRR